MQSKLDNMSSLAIIIPVYNVAGYVRQCIQSVLDQIEAGDQIVVVEDHSEQLPSYRRGNGSAPLGDPSGQAEAKRRAGSGAKSRNPNPTADYLLFLDK